MLFRSCDMTAEFYLQTVDTVFQRHLLLLGGELSMEGSGEQEKEDETVHVWQADGLAGATQDEKPGDALAARSREMLMKAFSYDPERVKATMPRIQTAPAVFKHATMKTTILLALATVGMLLIALVGVGGFTVLAAAGGTPDLTRITAHCAAHPVFYACRLIAGAGP